MIILFNPDVDDSSLVEPIDTSLICTDYKNFVLQDYNQCPYISYSRIGVYQICRVVWLDTKFTTDDHKLNPR